MDNIRVTYSGLIAFAVSLIGVATGAIFVIIVTRQLEPEEFAIWIILGTMLSYVAISQSAVSYWTLRQVARDEAVAKTSVISSGMLSLGVLPLYFAAGNRLLRGGPRVLLFNGAFHASHPGQLCERGPPGNQPWLPAPQGELQHTGL